MKTFKKAIIYSIFKCNKITSVGWGWAKFITDVHVNLTVSKDKIRIAN